ncbi:MAG: hypothetical protein UU47_C0015G0024 [candidate division TM6 bacterium GW2011_GWE2_41_16]|nr:MAG: hypothetical protein UU47_C0015G0024 [candidate division TM6 bacterium GW2011_GWE2_41_16]
MKHLIFSTLTLALIISPNIYCMKQEHAPKPMPVSTTIFSNTTQAQSASKLLVEAAHEGNYEDCERYLKVSGIDINKAFSVSRFANANTALGSAVQNGFVAIVELLLTHPNINPNIGSEQATPLMQAITASESSVTSFTKTGSITRVYGSRKNRIKIVHLLLKHPLIEPNVRKIGFFDPKEHSALDHAVQHCEPLFVWLLLQAKNSAEQYIVDPIPELPQLMKAADICQQEKKAAAREDAAKLYDHTIKYAFEHNLCIPVWIRYCLDEQFCRPCETIMHLLNSAVEQRTGQQRGSSSQGSTHQQITLETLQQALSTAEPDSMFLMSLNHRKQKRSFLPSLFGAFNAHQHFGHQPRRSRPGMDPATLQPITLHVNHADLPNIHRPETSIEHHTMSLSEIIREHQHSIGQNAFTPFEILTHNVEIHDSPVSKPILRMEHAPAIPPTSTTTTARTLPSTLHMLMESNDPSVQTFLREHDPLQIPTQLPQNTSEQTAPSDGQASSNLDKVD